MPRAGRSYSKNADLLVSPGPVGHRTVAFIFFRAIAPDTKAPMPLKQLEHLALATLLLLCAKLSAGESPNILIILVDDLGWGDPACQGSGSLVPTPNLDRIAAEGMRFTDAYCPVSVCTPSRQALMTGEYPWRTRRGAGVLANWDPPCIAATTTTLPAHLQQAGYATIGVGKWHLGCTWATSDGAKPVGQGSFTGSGDNVRLDVPISNGPSARGFSSWYGVICASEQFIVDGDRVVALMTQQKYQPPQAAGTEALPRNDTADYLVTVFARAAAAVRARHERPWMLYVAPYAPHAPLTPPSEFTGRTRAGTYGDYVHALDHHIGRLLSALDESGATANTLVLVASDNGSEFITTGEGHRPNGPLRGGKWTPYEGGVRTPLLVRWPGKVAPGTVTHGIVALTDVLATLAQVVGRPLPAGAGKDSISFLPTLLGQRDEGARREIAVRASQHGTYALRSDGWKWIASGTGPGELYDLTTDPGEVSNLAASQPDVVARLRQRLSKLGTGLSAPPSAP